MKKTLFAIGLAAACAFALTGCVKEVDPCTADTNLSESTPFELTVSLPATRTTIDEQFKVEWAEGDQINVFHAVHGSANYINDGAFTVKEAGLKGVFEGKVQGTIYPNKDYDWFVVYPYSEETVSPKEAVFRYNREYETPGDNENVNLQGLPLWSNALGVVGTSPVLQMHQVYSIAKVTFNNVNFSTMSIGNAKITAEKKYRIFNETIVPSGDASFDLTGEKLVVSSCPGYNPQHCTIHYETSWGETIKKGEDWTLYFPLLPAVYPAESSFCFTPNGNTCKYVSFLEPFEFKAGEIQEFNINYDKDQQYLTETQVADTVRFRFCKENLYLETAMLDQSSKGFWNNRKSNATLVSVYDFCNLNQEFNEVEESTTYYPRAYIKIADKQADNPKFTNDAARWYLATGKLTQGQSFIVAANFANLAAGKNVVFHSSFFLGKVAACKKYNVSYSVDGGATYAPATVAVEAEGDVAEAGVMTFANVADSECHPFVISTGALAAGIEKGSVMFKITLADATTGHVGFAPYYKYDGTVKTFTKEIGGGMNNLEGCAYITVE